MANDCRLVSEIKDYQTKLDAIEMEIKALRQFDDDIPTCFKMFNNHHIRHLCYSSLYGIEPIRYDHLAFALYDALQDINLDELTKELAALYNRETMLTSKENEATELRKKIDEAKNALGIK
jgi:hypothetical protein